MAKLCEKRKCKALDKNKRKREKDREMKDNIARL